MQQDEHDAFAVLVEALAATFRIEVTEALLEGYWMALDDLPLAAVRDAACKAMRQCQHMPRGVELRQLAGEVSAETRAVKAWGEVMQKIAGSGSWMSPGFADPTITATVRNLGGWQHLCSLSKDELEKWVRKDFERVYRALAESGATEDQTRPLIGAHEQHNLAHGYTRPEGLLEAPYVANRLAGKSPAQVVQELAMMRLEMEIE